jgi:colicin import membrane protein
MGAWLFSLCILAAGTVRGADGLPDAQRQQEHQKTVQADTNHMVRRTSTMLRVLDYYQLDKSAEKRFLDEVAATLAGLSREQMNEVIARLDKAARTPEGKKADQEVAQAYERHREILERLRGLLARYDAVKTLDQAAERLDRAGKEQLELHLRGDQLVQDWQNATDNRKPRQTLRTDLRREADDQGDLHKEVAAVLRQAAALRDELPAEQQVRLQKAVDLARDRQVLERMTHAVDNLKQPASRTEQLKAAADEQRRAAADLQDVARVLRTPLDRLTALREARTRLQQAQEGQESLRTDTQARQDPRVQDVEKQQVKQGGTRPAQDMADKQGRLEHTTHDAENLLKPHVEELANRLPPGEQAMRQAEEALRKNKPGDALTPQHRAEENLAAVRKDLDRLITEAEKQQSDPLAALQKAVKDVDRLIKEEKDAQRKTKEAEKNQQQAERLAQLAQQQKELARRTDEVNDQAPVAKQEAQAALDQAARSMEEAADALRDKKTTDALAKQDQAVKSLDQAKQNLAEQVAAIEKRRSEIAALEKAAGKLDKLAKEQAQVAEQAQAAARKEGPQDTHDLAKQQGELTPRAQEVGKDLKEASPQASAKVEQSAKHMENARAALNNQETQPGAKQAQNAADKLKEAQEAVAKALTENLGQEIADQAAMQPGEVDPANAAQQLAKAIEQGQHAAQASQAAAKQLEQKEAGKQAAKSMAKSQEGTQAAMAALGQAQALAPDILQVPLMIAGGELAQAGQELDQCEPAAAHESQQAAVKGMQQALQMLKAAAATMAQREAQSGKQSNATASAGRPGQAAGDKPGQEPGQKPGPGKNRGNKRTPSPDNNLASGIGDRLADGRLKNASSQLGEVGGDGAFLHLPPRQRDMIRQALSDKLPPEYAAFIQQYYVNIARGKPAAKPLTSEKR